MFALPTRTRMVVAAVAIGLAALVIELTAGDWSRLLPSSLLAIVGASCLNGLCRWTIPALWRLLHTDLVLLLLGFFAVRLAWGLAAQELGLFYVIWNEHWAIALMNGLGLGLACFILGYVAFLLDARNQIHAERCPDQVGEILLFRWLRLLDAWLERRALYQWLKRFLRGAAAAQANQPAEDAEPVDEQGLHMILWLGGPLLVLALMPAFYSTSGYEAFDWNRDRFREGFWEIISQRVFVAGSAILSFVIWVLMFLFWPRNDNPQPKPRLALLVSVGLPLLCFAGFVFIQPGAAAHFYVGALVLAAALGLFIRQWFQVLPRFVINPSILREYALRIRSRNLLFTTAVTLVLLHLWNLARDVQPSVWSCYFPAGFTFCLVLGAAALGYGWLRLYRRGAATLSVVALVLLYGLASGLQNYPHRIEELAEYYGRASKTSIADEQGTSFKPSLYHYEKLRHQPNPTLSEKGVLDAWARKVRQTPTDTDKPPLIILTTSGGASAAAIFTLTFLTEMERQWPGSARYVRIMAGASGGMVGAAYFRARLEELWRDNDKQRRTRLIERMHEEMAKDFLSPIAQQVAFKDLVTGFCPFSYARDRGWALERAWDHFMADAMGDLRYEKLFEQEKGGHFPSLIFSPVLVEDGRQLLISTLDLDPLIQPDLVDPAGGYPDDRLRRLRAVEFFKLFPDAKKFRLSTAARMNASFPFLSPGVTLPTVPSRRVVDAGYYDNHGMNVAVAWADANRHWLQRHTSQVIILQIRPWDMVGGADDPEWIRDNPPPIGDAEWEMIRSPKNKKTGDVNWWLEKSWFSLEEYTTPLEGGAASLFSSMVFRNAQQLQLFQKVLPRNNITGFRGVVSYTIAGNLDASLDWYLPSQQVHEIEATIGVPFQQANGQRPVPRAGDNKWYEKKPRFKDAVMWNQKEFEHLFKKSALAPYLK